MTRTGSMIRFHLRRERKPVLLIFCFLLAIILLVTIYYTKDKGRIALSYGEGGTFYGIPVSQNEITEYGYYSSTMSVDTDYSGLFVLTAIVLTCRMITKERRFLTSLGGTRLEVLAAHAGAVGLMSVGLCALSWLLMVLARVLLCVFGFRFRGGWNAAMIFFGQSGDTFSSLAMAFSEMICLCGFFTLFLALWQRWWKVLLVLCGAGFTLCFVLILQLAFNFYADNLLEIIEAVVDWLQYSFIPFVDKWFVSISQTRVFLRRIVIGLGCMALTYPVLVRMKLK